MYNMLVQEYSLKGHGAGVSASGVFGGSLVTGDDLGWLVVWNTVSRRPSAIWKAHDARIVSIAAIDGTRLLTHGRDSRIRIWTITSNNNSNGTVINSTFPPDGEYHQHHPNDTLYPTPEYQEIAVNSVNFCNVSYGWNRLVTPATMVSECVDVYLVFGADGQFQPKRLVRLFDGYKVVGGNKNTENDQNDPNDPFGSFQDNGIEEDVSLTKRDGYGIVMRLQMVAAHEFVVAYENGVVLGVQMDDTGKQFTLAFVDNCMEPNPVTWMGLGPGLGLDYDYDVVAYGSTTKKVALHWCGTNEHRVLDVGNSGIQLVCGVPGKGVLLIGFWNGLVRAVDAQSGSTVFKVTRKVPMIDTVETNVGGDQTEKPRSSPYIKMTGMVMMVLKRAAEPLPPSGSRHIDYRSKVRLKQEGDRLAVTYEDGSIVVFKWV